MESLAREFQHQASFKVVYCAEAHASDVWPISSGRYHDNEPVSITAPRTNEERCSIAAQFKERYKLSGLLPILVDPIDDRFERAYAVWPLRFFVLQQGTEGVRVVFKAMPKDASYDIKALRDFLIEHCT